MLRFPIILLTEFAEVRPGGSPRASRGCGVKCRHGGPGILARETPTGQVRAVRVSNYHREPMRWLYSLAFVGTRGSQCNRVKIATFRGKYSWFQATPTLKIITDLLRESLQEDIRCSNRSKVFFIYSNFIATLSKSIPRYRFFHPFSALKKRTNLNTAEPSSRLYEG